MKAYVRRPRWLVCLTAVLAANALGMPLQAMLLYGHAPWEWAAIWAKLAPQNVLVLVLAPPAALGLWRVRRWGWWMVVGFCLAVAINNVILLQYPSTYPRILILSGAGVALAGLAWFGTPGVLALFRDPSRHWWRAATRYSLAVPVQIHVPGKPPAKATTHNVSCSGMFLTGAPEDLAPGDRMEVELCLGSRRVTCSASVVRHSKERGSYPQGYGLRFHGVNVLDAAFLRFGLAAAVAA
jgi:hypothetical protein